MSCLTTNSLHGRVFSLCPFVNTSNGHTHLLLGVYACTATPSLHYTEHFLFSLAPINENLESQITWVMAFLYAPFIYLLFFRLFYLLISSWFLSALSRLRSLGYIVPDKHFCSPDKSFVWRYLFCEIVLVTCRRAFWRNMIAQIQTHTHFDIRGSTAKRVNTPLPSPWAPLFNSSQPSAKARELFSETLFEIHLQTLKSLLLFNHTLLTDF